jgi:hypothetical protein
MYFVEKVDNDLLGMINDQWYDPVGPHCRSSTMYNPLLVPSKKQFHNVIRSQLMAPNGQWAELDQICLHQNAKSCVA